MDTSAATATASQGRRWRVRLAIRDMRASRWSGMVVWAWRWRAGALGVGLGGVDAVLAGLIGVDAAQQLHRAGQADGFRLGDLGGGCGGFLGGEPGGVHVGGGAATPGRSEEHTSELQSHVNLVCRLLLEKKKKKTKWDYPYQQKTKTIRR